MKNKRVKRIVLFCIIGIFIASVSIAFGATLGDSGKDALRTLRELQIDGKTNLFADFLRWLGFSVAKWLGSAVDALSSGIHNVYELLSFGSSSAISSLVNRYSTLYKAIFILSVLGLGLYFIMGKRGNQLNTVNCIVIMAVVIVGMPLFTTKLADMTINATTYAQNQWTTAGDYGSVAGTVVKNNIVDLKKVDKNGIDKVKKDTAYNDINISNDTGKARSWRTLDINAIMDWDTSGAVEQDYWGYVLDDDNETVLEQNNGFLGIGKSYYYRYQVLSWFNIIMSLLIMVVAFFFCLVKCARLVWEVAMAQIWLPFVAITDISSGQRIKEGIKHFLVLFLSIFLCIALFGVFFAANTYISSLNLSSFIKIILQIALAWTIIDGPNILERIFGVDVGMQSGWQFVMGARAAGGAAATAARAGRNAAAMGFAGGKNIGRKVAGEKSARPITEMPPADGKRHGGVAGKVFRGERFDGSSPSHNANAAAANTAASQGTEAAAKATGNGTTAQAAGAAGGAANTTASRMQTGADSRPSSTNAPPSSASSGTSGVKSTSRISPDSAGRQKNVIPKADPNRVDPGSRDGRK